MFAFSLPQMRFWTVGQVQYSKWQTILGVTDVVIIWLVVILRDLIVIGQRPLCLMLISLKKETNEFVAFYKNLDNLFTHYSFTFWFRIVALNPTWIWICDWIRGTNWIKRIPSIAINFTLWTFYFKTRPRHWRHSHKIKHVKKEKN